MGFATENVLSDEGHVTEFICPICCGLAETPVVSRCHHVFCKTCIGQWLDRKHESPQCPTCNGDVAGSTGVLPLKEGAPLAHRVLLRVRVKCPLHEQGCEWNGDYSELMSHITNSTEHAGTALPGQTAAANAKAIKVSRAPCRCRRGVAAVDNSAPPLPTPPRPPPH